MPDLTSNAATLRRGGFNFTGYLSTIPQTVVLAGTVTAVPTYPALAIAYTLTGGSAGDVYQDMTVRFYSSGGTFKGMLRIASGATTTSSSLKVNEFAAGVYDVQIGDTFEVIDEFRILDRLVSATSALNKDSRITYSDQLSNQVPVCNSGGPSPGFTTSRNFYGSTSFTIDPDSAGTLTHSWDYIDGSGTTNVANPTGVTFPVGFRWIEHTATDSGNSKATLQKVPVWVHDATYPPLSVQVDNLSTQGTNPARMTFKLPFDDQGSITNLPNGAMVCYWETERYNGTEASYGSNVSDRSHVKFTGYLLRDTISIDPEQNEVTFEATNSLGILEQTPALPQLLISDSTPSNWQEMKGLTTKKIFWYLSYFGATLQTVWDFVWTDGLDLSYARIAIDGSNSIADQLRDVANSLNVDVTCDALGRIQFIRHPAYLTESERNSRTKTYDFTTADIIRIEWTNEHQGSVKLVKGEGLTPSGAAVFSKFPGDAPASWGTGSDTLAKQIVADLSDLRRRTGLHGCRLNGLFNGRFVPKSLRMTVPDGYDILEPANREFVTITLPASTNTRGVSFASTERWTVESKDITYDAELGSKDIVYTLDHETFGVDGAPDTAPSESQNGVSPYPPFDTQFLDYGLDTIQQTGLIGGAITLAIVCDDNKIYLTTNFDNPSASGGPTYTSIDLTALTGWPGGTVVCFEVDAYSPKYLGTGTAVNGWIRTTTHVMRITDIFGSTALTGIVGLHATTTLAKTSMRFERGEQNWGIISTWYNADGVWAAYTTDGLTWTEAQIDANYDTNYAFIGSPPGLALNPHNAGEAYTSIYTATTGFAAAALRRTTDHGATWSSFSPSTSVGNTLANCVVVPYQATDFQTIYYAHTTGSGTFDPRLYRTNASGTVDISPDFSGAKYSAHSFTRAFSVCDDNRNVGMLCGIDEYAGGSNRIVAISNNLEATTPTWTVLLGPDPSIVYHQVYASSVNAFYLIGAGGAIAFSDGVTVDSRIGNIRTGGEVIGICGG